MELQNTAKLDKGLVCPKASCHVCSGFRVESLGPWALGGVAQEVYVAVAQGGTAECCQCLRKLDIFPVHLTEFLLRVRHVGVQMFRC